MGRFDSLVYIIGTLVDEKATRFSGFRPVVDVYIEQHFKFNSVHGPLVFCFKSYLSKADDPTQAKNIRNSIKALEYLFKFIVASRLNSDSKEAATFDEDLRGLLGEINALMKRTTPEWVLGAQALTLKVRLVMAASRARGVFLGF